MNQVYLVSSHNHTNTVISKEKNHDWYLTSKEYFLVILIFYTAFKIFILFT